MSEIDLIIKKLFESRWHGELVLSSLDSMKAELHKTLTNQINGYWSGHTAYHIAVDGGFLIDADTKSQKKLTAEGQYFMNHHNQRVRSERR